MSRLRNAWMALNGNNTLRTAGSSLGHKSTPEQRAKISAALKGHKINVGRKHSERRETAQCAC